MSDSQWRTKIDRRSSDWIDTDAGDLEPRSDEFPIDNQSLSRVADLQFVDAILAGLSGRTMDDRNERIRRVMDAIPDVTRENELHEGESQSSKPTLSIRTRLLRWSPLVALAACLLAVCALSSVSLMRESRAETLLPEINEVAVQRIDRVYDIRRLLRSSEGMQVELRGRLYLRGVEGFVVTCGGAVLGRNGNEFWFVSPSGRVIIADDFAWMIDESEKERQELGLLKELSVESSRVPLMQLSSVAQLMQYDYEVVVHSGVRHGQQTVDELVGKQRSGNSELPDTIRLWSGAESRIIHGAQFVWEKEQEKSQPNILAFELIDAEVVPEDWYDHESHHSADPPIRRVPVDL